MADVLKATVGEDEPGVLIYAIGPWVGGRRKPSILRVRLVDNRFTIENKSGTGALGRWQALGHAADFPTAIQGMKDLNNRELAKHGLRTW